MSVVRFGEGGSDVYVYPTSGLPGQWECCGCYIHTPRFNCSTVDEMADHLRQHLATGDIVPSFVFDRLAERGGT